MYQHYLKRILDFLISLFSIIVLLLIFTLIAVAIKLDSKGPVFFRQKRITKGRKEFQILKFRTMSVDTPKDMPTHLLQGSETYITRVGQFLRKSSLDELPQLFNIIKGEMAIVGPRPALWNQEDLLEERDRYGANDILPGLTGLAQVSGRDELPIEVKAAYDGEYVLKMSFLFDCAIIFRTIFSVVKADGVVEGSNSIKGKEKER